MKLTWATTPTGQVGFHVDELSEYDAEPPVRSLLLDHAPSSVNPEREAVAAYLAFGRWVSGDLELPRGLGPNTAHAIEQDMKHVSVRPRPVEYYAKPLDIGVREVGVNFAAGAPDPSIPIISILDSAEWSGALRGLRSVTVASNAVQLDRATSLGIPRGCGPDRRTA